MNVQGSLTKPRSISMTFISGYEDIAAEFSWPGTVNSKKGFCDPQDHLSLKGRDI